MLATEPKPAVQTVTPEGRSVSPRIDGVLVHEPVTHQDERGSLCEIYSPCWGLDDLPLAHAYLVTIRPGRVKGWALHLRQVDRYFFCHGVTKLVLYDDRELSPTHGMVNELYFSEINRSLVSVPPGVYHAVENVGDGEALMFNIPSLAYDHANPDKLTLPIENGLIPYSFDRPRGY